jgi:hypothetical protein
MPANSNGNGNGGDGAAKKPDAPQPICEAGVISFAVASLAKVDSETQSAAPKPAAVEPKQEI